MVIKAIGFDVFFTGRKILTRKYRVLRTEPAGREMLEVKQRTRRLQGTKHNCSPYNSGIHSGIPEPSTGCGQRPERLCFQRERRVQVVLHTRRNCSVQRPSVGHFLTAENNV